MNMSRKYKTSHKVYTAWNYEKEIEDLNAQSEKGWQLINEKIRAFEAQK